MHDNLIPFYLYLGLDWLVADVNCHTFEGPGLQITSRPSDHQIFHGHVRKSTTCLLVLEDEHASWCRLHKCTPHTAS